ncbi:hypothetical protein K490DRAFT_59726 [Saccharata proteae CBS 121410]|uniref:RRM domain-containing protein n=1 Tax=Saccharata proteae CBS 121410 TaxID=1314787 RepID=A0A9P4HQV4_9PEZI|nr:hypothetical protein K490DRAFT_59726 [Saccharata proteae CBS 121410]
MPPPSRIGGHPRREPHFFIVSGVWIFTSSRTSELTCMFYQLPGHWTWQNLKDLVRSYMLRNGRPGWTEMAPSQDGQTGERGYFGVARDDDADNVFNLLSRCQSPQLVVHHFDASGESPVLRRCNCHMRFGTSAHSDAQSHISVQSVLVLPPQMYTVGPPYPVPVLPVTWSTTPNAMAPVQPLPYYNQMQAHMAPPPPTYYQPTAERPPVNTSQGIVRTEARGVHISGLPYTTTESQLRQVLSQYGEPLRLRAANGSATVTFRTRAEADQATRALDNNFLGGRQLSARYDREETAVSRSSRSPVIANGASPRTCSRDADLLRASDQGTYSYGTT